MIKDKKYITILITAIVLMLSLFYYFGEERTRHFEEEGMVVCKKNKLEIWTSVCDSQDPWYKF